LDNDEVLCCYFGLSAILKSFEKRNQETLEEANDIEKLLDTLGASELLVVCECGI
jgi:hypothetical protein